MSDQYSSALLESTRLVVRPWLRRLCDGVMAEQGLTIGTDPVNELVESLAEAVEFDLSALLEMDVEHQRRNPLDIFRSAAVEVSGFLVAHGARAVERDEFLRRAFPDDSCGLAPATWSDIDGSLAGPGIEWGAYKAATIMARHPKNRT